jgi:hypothetical protein
MPQLTSVVLTDRQATPVAHTFTPEDITSGVGSLAESSGVPIGDKRVTISMKKTSDRRKPELRFSFPVVQDETINGVTRPVVVRTSYVDLKFNFDATSSEEERNDIVGMLEDALTSGKSVFHDVIVKLQGVY